MTREETEARDRLLFHLENQTGFWFALVAGDDPRPRTRLREAAETFCREHGQPFILHAPHPQHLMGLAAELAKGESPGLHWIRADGPKALVSQWDSAVRELLVAMNERREAYRRRLDGGVVIEGRESLKRYLRDLAPDLFSIRAFIAEPGISPEFTRPSIPEWRVPRFSFISMFAVTADPERELARAARLADMDSVEARRARAEMLLVGTAGLLMARRAQDAERPCHDLASEVERLLREHPQDPRVNRLLVSTRLTQARVAAANGSSEEALRYLDEAEATLVARAAGLSEVERGVAVVEMMGLLSDRGNVLLGLKNPSGAIESFRKQVEIAQALVNSDESNQEMQIELCAATFALAEALRKQGDLVSSASLLRDIVARAEQRAEEHRDEHHWRMALLRFRRELGEVFVARGDLAGALEELRAAERLAVELVDLEESNEDLLLELWRIYGGIMSALVAQSEWSEAIITTEQMLAAAEKGVERFRAPERWGWLAVLNHAQRAEILEKQGDIDSANAALTASWARVSTLPMSAVDVALAKVLIELHIKLAGAELDRDRVSSAFSLFKRAIKLGERVLKLAPDDSPIRIWLETAYKSSSLILKFCGRRRAAARLRRRANALRRRRAYR